MTNRYFVIVYFHQTSGFELWLLILISVSGHIASILCCDFYTQSVNSLIVYKNKTCGQIKWGSKYEYWLQQYLKNFVSGGYSVGYSEMFRIPRSAASFLCLMHLWIDLLKFLFCVIISVCVSVLFHFRCCN